MNYLKLKQKIYEAIERNPLDRSAYEEMFAVCREYEKIDFQTAHAWNHELRNHISWGLRMTVSCQKFDEAREFDDLMFRSLLFGAQHFFDDYLQAVEYGNLDSYDKVLITDDMSCPIDENTVLFVDSKPGYRQGKPAFDYTVKRVAKSLNTISYAVSKVKVS